MCDSVCPSLSLTTLPFLNLCGGNEFIGNKERNELKRFKNILKFRLHTITHLTFVMSCEMDGWVDGEAVIVAGQKQII